MPEGSPLGNRRAYVRQPMFTDVALRVPGMRSGVPATLVDISGGGCRIATQLMIKPHADVEFDLPAGSRALKLSGRIAKVRYIPVDRTFHYGISFESLDEPKRDVLLRYISAEQRRTLEEKRVRLPSATEDRAAENERREHARARIPFPVSYAISGVPSTLRARALDVGAGGIRISTDRILRVEWAIELRFSLPNDVLRMAHQIDGQAHDLRPFAPMRVKVRPLPGVMRMRERYIQRLAFMYAASGTVAEIERFVAISQTIEK